MMNFTGPGLLAAEGEIVLPAWAALAFYVLAAAVAVSVLILAVRGTRK
jgi:hypothetical protein